MRSVVLRLLCPETNPQQQVVVLRRFDLFGSVAPFQRCLRCNGLLSPVSKETIIDLPPQIQQSVDEFHRCLECGQIYWKGSHYERMQNSSGCAQFSIASMIVNRAANICTAAQTRGH